MRTGTVGVRHGDRAIAARAAVGPGAAAAAVVVIISDYVVAPARSGRRLRVMRLRQTHDDPAMKAASAAAGTRETVGADHHIVRI